MKKSYQVYSITKDKIKPAFTMIEMVFVIVILGILASVAIPRFSATRTDAEITKGRADVASIRSAIVNERQTRLIKGDSTFINKLHSSATSYFDSNGGTGMLLMYGVKPQDSSGHWITGASCTDAEPANVCTYTYRVQDVDTVFTYTQTTGKFTCVDGSGYCSELVD